MVFEPISWAIGLGLTKGLTRALEKTLSSKLEDAVRKWMKDLPAEVQFTPEALFDSIQAAYDEKEFPARAALREEFKTFRIPTQTIWLHALVERWHHVNMSNDVCPFFKQSAKTATEQLNLLAALLEDVCASDERLFQTTVYHLTTEINKYIREAEPSRLDLEKAETYIQKGFDNAFINEIRIAGHVSEADGIRRAIYLDSDRLYVHRAKQEDRIKAETIAFNKDPQARSKWISIVGDAGHGKSSLLWHLFTSFKEHKDVSVFCVLAQLSGKDILNRLECAIPLIKGNAIILLDTLDLLVGLNDARLAAVLNNIRNTGHLLITTSRRQEIKRLPNKSDIEIELGRYTDEEAQEAIHNYIRACYPTMNYNERQAQFESIWNILDSKRKIQELDLEPLILSMIFQAYAPNAITQEINTQKIYQKFWQERMLEDRTVRSSEERQARIKLCHLLAHNIVFSISGSDSFAIGDLERVWKDVHRCPFPYDTLENLVSSGILHWTCGQTHVRFFHQTFLEYTEAMYVRLASETTRQELMTALYDDFGKDIYWRIPVLKQIAVQDFHEGEGNLWKEVLIALRRVQSLYSLQIALEISGKIGDDDGYSQRICKQWIASQPSHMATTVCERVKYYPKMKIPLALELLEPCLGTHEEIAIYNICSVWFAPMNANAVHAFLRKQISLMRSRDIKDGSTSFKEALVSVFRFGTVEALNDLLALFPSLTSGQRAGLIDSLSPILKPENAQNIADFCEKIINFVIGEQKGEVRHSFINLLLNLRKFAGEEVRALSQKVFDLGQWKTNEVAAIFTGTLVGKFHLDTEKIRFFCSNIHSTDPFIRVFSTWALLDPDPLFHGAIMDEIMKSDIHNLSEDKRQMVFKVVSSLTNIEHERLMQFLNTCPWPISVVLPNEFRKIFTILAEGGSVEATKRWLFTELEKANGMRFRQAMNGLLGIIVRNIGAFTAQELRQIYQMARRDNLTLSEFADVVGLFVYVDAELASEIFHQLLQSGNQNLRTGTMLSLAISINDHLEFTLSQGDRVLTLSGEKDRFGLLHCFLKVLREYRGNKGIQLIKRLDGLFTEPYLESLHDENSLTELLTLLKIYAQELPEQVLQIARRCPPTTQGLAGALSAIYANAVASLENSDDLSRILHDLMSMAKFRQRHIRNALIRTLPLLAIKIGYRKVFKIFFDMYKKIVSTPGFEDLVKAIMRVPEWSEEETVKLLNDQDLSPQVRSLLLSRTFGS